VIRALAFALLILLFVGWAAGSAAEVALDAGSLQTFRLEPGLAEPLDAPEMRPETAATERERTVVLGEVESAGPGLADQPDAIVSGSEDAQAGAPHTEGASAGEPGPRP
jgi:hypothetical protein